MLTTPIRWPPLGGTVFGTMSSTDQSLRLNREMYQLYNRDRETMSAMREGQRPAPLLSGDLEPFWRGGAAGELLIQRCQVCGWWLHPPRPLCPQCLSRELRPEVASGRGTVWSFTVNRYQWNPALAPPYVVAEVELEEQAGLRLLSAIVDCDDVTIGMSVSARFEAAGDAWVPVFAP